MTAQEIGQQIHSMITPRLQELGLSAFVIAGYVTDGEGKVARIVVGNGGQNPAFTDGLRPMIHFASVWESGKL